MHLPLDDFLHQSALGAWLTRVRFIEPAINLHLAAFAPEMITDSHFVVLGGCNAFAERERGYLLPAVPVD
ncbi:hypothetical protein BOTNAR_0240g00170 [Botryotinia narcissicola]|uniref:Uncharacterized protein n=1 Tax=Botryotinia narcissicola TaxID=278944 RepID=A0A4Z1I9W1_9HELO|nr:hypothetical protein BOTNAR_0240g00170 [Botryotinia narcissicola]